MKLNTSWAYTELYGERGQKLSTWEGGMASRKASKIGSVKASTECETGGGHLLGTGSATRVVSWGCEGNTARQCMNWKRGDTVERKESQEGDHGEGSEDRRGSHADLHRETGRAIHGKIKEPKGMRLWHAAWSGRHEGGC